METKPLLFGLIGFFVGGFLVSVAATTFDKPKTSAAHANTQMIASLKDKTGDDYDKAFTEEMIVHHQGAVEMAKLSAENAKHEEIKELSEAIISSQEQEISEMRQWQRDWGYSDDSKMGH